MAPRKAAKVAPGAGQTVLQAPHALSRGMNAGDTLVNLMTGMGTEKDKLAGTVFGYSEIGKAQLDAAYRGDWISRKIVNIPAYDAFREWRGWQADAKDITAIEEVEKALKIQRKAMLALQRGRLYGGGALILGVNQGKSDEPLNFDTLGKGCLQFVHVVSRYDLSSGEMDWDVMSPYFGTPKYYTKSSEGGGVLLKLHPSRVIRFVGEESTDLTLAQGWGDSILQVCADAVLACGTVASSAAQLVAEAKIDIVKIPELSEKITDKGYEDRLKRRFGLASTMKSVFGMLIVDAAEEWDRINQTFIGLPDMLKMYLLIASGAADIPATRMLGQSPAGLSATGDSDTRNYYDRTATEQTVVIAPAMEPLDRVILASALGSVPKDIVYEWNPLWQMDPKDVAEIATKKAAVMTADVNAGLITPLVLQKARENQLIEDGTYPGLEGFIEEFGDDVDAREEAAAAAALEALQAQAAANENNPPTNASGQPIKKKAGTPPAQGAIPARGRRTATGDMADRIGGRSKSLPQVRVHDVSTPRTLYIYRDVLNAGDIKKWAKQAGFKSSVDDMHVTIIYSKMPVDWLKIGADDFGYGSEKDGKLTIKAGGPRVLEKFGKAVVLAFANSDLQYRHMSAMNRGEADGITWSHEDYTPHITITYDGGALDILHIEAYQGEIVLGPEIFEEINPAFNNEIDAKES